MHDCMGELKWRRKGDPPQSTMLLPPCTVCHSPPSSLDSARQLLPCLHIICGRCLDTKSGRTTCPSPGCCSPLWAVHPSRLNRCDAPLCRRKLFPAGELVFLDCRCQLCPECFDDVLRAALTRGYAQCLRCSVPVAREGEELCDECAVPFPTDRMKSPPCCKKRICPKCAEKKRVSATSTPLDPLLPKCPDGRCKAAAKSDKATLENPMRCLGDTFCEGQPLSHFPSDKECEHSLCMACIQRAIDIAEANSNPPACPTTGCSVPYGTDSLRALRVLFPERVDFFNKFEAGVHYGIASILRDTSAKRVEFDESFDSARWHATNIALSDDEEKTTQLTFDRRGTVGDLIREVRRELDIGTTEKVYGYLAKIQDEEFALVLSPAAAAVTLEDSGLLEASLITIDIHGVVLPHKFYMERVPCLALP